MHTKIKPINKEHAVQEVSFSLQLSENLTESSIARLIELKEVLKNEFSFGGDLKLQINPDQFIGNKPANIPENTIVGIILRNVQENGKVDWAVQAMQNIIAVSCSDYKGWKKTWPKARTYLETLAGQVIDTNPIKVINLQYTNLFISPSSSSVDLSQLLNFRSHYLSENIKKTNSLWHMFQGWLEEDAILKCKCLNNLNLATTFKDQDFITSITLLRQAQLGEESFDLERLDGVMNQLHVNLKKILENILTLDMARAIGLNNE